MDNELTLVVKRDETKGGFVAEIVLTSVSMEDTIVATIHTDSIIVDVKGFELRKVE